MYAYIFVLLNYLTISLFLNKINKHIEYEQCERFLQQFSWRLRANFWELVCFQLQTRRNFTWNHQKIIAIFYEGQWHLYFGLCMRHWHTITWVSKNGWYLTLCAYPWFSVFRQIKCIFFLENVANCEIAKSWNVNDNEW